MSDSERKVSGIEPLDDDELDAAAGGFFGTPPTMSPQEARAKAASEGRELSVPAQPGVKCDCFPGYYYAQSVGKQNNRTVYNNVKCYICGKTWVSLA